MSLTEHWMLHSTSDVVGTEKMFALSSDVTLPLVSLWCCRFLRSDPKLRRLDAHSECNAVLARALLNAKEKAKPKCCHCCLTELIVT